MNRYLVEYQTYFGGKRTLEVNALNKADAVAEAKAELAGDIYVNKEVKPDSVKVVKKLQR